MKFAKLMLRPAVMALALLTMTPGVQAHENKKGDLTIIHAQARPNLPSRPTAAYMAITNDGTEADRLISAKSEAFGTIEIHTTMQHGDVLKMQPVDAIEVPAEDTALLEPGGLHLMLFDGAKPHKIGESFMMVLTFEKAGDVMVEVKVEKITGGGDHSQHAGGAAKDHSGHSGHKKAKTE